MKTVLTNAELPHLWAHQSQAEGRNPSKSFYFEGLTIFSYGPHFPIARHIERKGKKAILFTSRCYSNTTARHKSKVRSAIPPSIPVFTVDNVLSNPTREDLLNLETDALKEYKSAQRAKDDWTKQIRAEHASRLLAQCEAMAQFFGWKYSRPEWEKLSEAVARHTKAEKARQAKEEKARQAKEEKARQERLECEQKQIAEFLVGTRFDVFHHELNPVLRVDNENGERIVLTSRGARVPLDHAKKAWRFLRPLLNAGKEWHTNGHKIPVGPFQIESLGADGTLKAGCHTFDKAELLRFGAILENL